MCLAAPVGSVTVHAILPEHSPGQLLMQPTRLAAAGGAVCAIPAEQNGLCSGSETGYVGQCHGGTRQ